MIRTVDVFARKDRLMMKNRMKIHCLTEGLMSSSFENILSTHDVLHMKVPREYELESRSSKYIRFFGGVISSASSYS